MEVQPRKKKVTKPPNFLSVTKSLGFFRASFTQESLNLCWLSVSLLQAQSSSLGSSREKPVAHLPQQQLREPQTRVGWMWARASCSGLCILPVAPALQPAGLSVCHKHSIHAAGCRSCPARDRLFCLAELTGHPVAEHLLLPLPRHCPPCAPEDAADAWHRRKEISLCFSKLGLWSRPALPGHGDQGELFLLPPGSPIGCSFGFFTLLFAGCFLRMWPRHSRNWVISRG